MIRLLQATLRDTSPVDLHVSTWSSPWGPIAVAWTDRGLCGLELQGNPRDAGHPRLPVRQRIPTDPPPDVVVAALQRSLQGLDLIDEIQVDTHGWTPFQIKVLNQLAQVPRDELVTYGELARAIDCRSAQAVGQAVGANPVPWLIPCHRVVAAQGQLGGFSAGLTWKARLLSLEHPNGIGLSAHMWAACQAWLA